MAFDGSGTYNRTDGTRGGTTVWTQASAAGVKILSADHDTHDQDIGTALSNCLCRDGQSTVTANIPMNSKKFTGLTAGSAATDSVTLAQTQASAALWLGTTSGTNTITATVTPAIAAYAAGQRFIGLAGGTNTGATTLNINSVGAGAVQVMGAGACVGGEIKSGHLVEIVYDGSNFRLVSPPTLAWASYTPTYGAQGAMDWTPTDTVNFIQLGSLLFLHFDSTATTDAGAATSAYLTATLPSGLTLSSKDNSGHVELVVGTFVDGKAVGVSGTTALRFYKQDNATFAQSTATTVFGVVVVEIA